MPTVEAYKDFIRKHKEKNCPAFSNKKKEQLKKLAEKLGYKEPQITAPKPKPAKKQAKPPVKPPEKKQAKPPVKPPEKKEVKTQPPEPVKEIEKKESPDDEYNQKFWDYLNEIDDLYRGKVDALLKPLRKQKDIPGYEENYRKAVGVFNKLRSEMIDKSADMIEELRPTTTNDLMAIFYDSFIRLDNNQKKRMKNVRQLTRKQMEIQKK